MKRFAITLVLVTMVGAAAPAIADRPARGCPPPFDAVDLSQLTEIIRQQIPTATDQAIGEYFEFYDKNQDDLVCNKATGQSTFNVVDNTSNAHAE
jgi:hypothetical protein